MPFLSDYDYNLPDELIAQEPLADRAASRLLVLDRQSGAVAHRKFRDVTDLLFPGDLLILNNTRVSSYRLYGHRATGGKVEALLLRDSPRGPGCLESMLKPAARIRIGEPVDFGEGLRAKLFEKLADGIVVLEFEDPEGLAGRLDRIGRVPLPPYIHAQLEDKERYQTVYNAVPGSSAAPTAGLHFTSEIFESLQNIGVKIAYVTLDVGIDTFRPVQVEDLSQHVMHGERCTVPEATEEAVSNCQGRIIAVGTTSVRTLETHAIGRRELRAGTMVSKLFIQPGFEFQICDGMFTNFHLPKTTMLLMVSAMCTRGAMLSAYEEAKREKYRFLSFGDSMLIV